MGVRVRSAVILPLLAMLLIGYFAFYTFFGERSLLRLMRLETEIQTTQEKLDGAQGEHDAIAARVNRMRPGSIDPDLLDEQVRRTLNYTAPDEIVIYTKDHAPATGTTGTAK